MNDSRVFFTSEEERINILEVVMGSNHFLIQPQTVGKKAGAPIIYFYISISIQYPVISLESSLGKQARTKILSNVSG